MAEMRNDQSIVRSMSRIFILSVIAKFIAFAKSMIQASYYGVTIQTDAYNMANGIVSNVLYMFTTAIAVAYVPIYIQKKAKKENEYRFATITITALTIGAVILTVIMEVAAPVIMKLAVPGYKGEIFSCTVLYFRVLLVGFVFSLVANIYQNILNAEKVYGYANFSSIINSIVLILIIAFFANKIGIWALIISVPLSYLCQYAVLYFRGHRYGRISLRYGLNDSDIKTLALLAFPILLSQATVEINQVVDRAILSSVEEGAVTAVSYAAVLYQFAMHNINIPVSTVMFTELSESAADHNYDRMSRLLSKTYKMIFLICIPVMVVTITLSEEIVTVVYGHGLFGSKAIEQTAVGLFGYIFCLIPVVLKNVISRAYYGLSNTLHPMLLGMLEVALNIILSIMLGRRYGIIGVVGATAISSFVFIVVMMAAFEKTYFRVLYVSELKGYWRIAAGMGISCVMAYLADRVQIENIYFDFTVKACVIVVSYLLSLLLFREEMAYSIVEKFVRKGRKV